MNLIGHISEMTDEKTFDVELEDATVRGLLEKMSKTCSQDGMRLIISETGELRVMILVNGVDIDFIKKLDTPLRYGDAVDIIPPIVGG